MARVRKCTFGKISGTVGDLTFYVYRGEQKVRLRIKRSRWKVNLFAKVRRVSLTPDEVQFLNRSILFSFLSFFFRSIKWLIFPYWRSVVLQKKLRLTPCNMFIKYNAAPFYRSLPRRKDFLSRSNMPDFGTIWLSYGRLSQPTQVPLFSYTSGTIHVSWDAAIWGAESPDDRVLIVCVYFPIENVKWEPKLWRTARVWTIPNSPSDLSCPLRKEGAFTFTVDKGLAPIFLHVWLFFANQSTCSRSYSCRLVI